LHRVGEICGELIWHLVVGSEACHIDDVEPHPVPALLTLHSSNFKLLRVFERGDGLKILEIDDDLHHLVNSGLELPLLLVGVVDIRLGVGSRQRGEGGG
jgi:hypothetical protein